jgi:hypothetical protein
VLAQLRPVIPRPFVRADARLDVEVGYPDDVAGGIVFAEASSSSVSNFSVDDALGEAFRVQFKASIFRAIGHAP